MHSKFATVPDKPVFPDEEVKVLKFWEEINAFHKQLELSEGKKEYTFYDGPPFATGLPHYGHIAAGTIKDVVTRYATMTGHHCSRRFGWDCHGLPIEFEIDKIHKIENSVQREELGVKRYNELCREIVMRYSKEWRSIVNRFGRWIDFDDDYKTMDAKFMESVWYAFSQIFKKGLVYRGTKIMPFSTACNTVLSNFEAGSNYKEVSDPAIIITFPAITSKANLQDVNFIAWTTTPWTLPSNLALAVNKAGDYVIFLDEATNKKYICMKERLQYVAKNAHIKKHKVLEEFKGEAIVGTEYTSLFNYFEDRRQEGCFRVIHSDHVTTDTGTGIVHMAPGFGEDDYLACIKEGLIKPGEAPVPIDQDGKFLPKIADYHGIYIKEADKQIQQDLKTNGRLLAAGSVVHNYPFCWRSQTPLIYRGFDCWFIKVTEIKEQLIAQNKTTKWIPEFVQEKRFHNWLVDAKDWCFSRNRYWGNPIPIWVSDDGEEVVCVSSIKELEELSGQGPLTDIHREYVDNIQIPSKMGKGMLKRIPEVFDCWFESGSMPFAQSHYPFSVSEEDFMKGFPANFIAEGLDQTRGWFYTLMVISTAIKGVAPFQNLICNGIVLAEDGSKMSKSKKNYPDPVHMADKYGADAVRLYLCNSPVVRAEPLKFAADGVHAIVRDIFLPWFNAYRFCIQNISRWEKRTGQNFVYDSDLKFKVKADKDSNFMDRYIIAANQHLIRDVRKEMDEYRLYSVVRHILDFLENLTNWYVRLNRPRMKGEDNSAEDQKIALNTLFDAILNATQLMAPITPFLCEHIYQNMRNGLPDGSPLKMDSIHFTDIPSYSDALIDLETEETVIHMQQAIETGRLIRDRVNIPMKYPLAKVIIVDANEQTLAGYKTLEKYIKEELNVLEVVLAKDEDTYVMYKAAPDNRAMGQAFGKKFDKATRQQVENLTSEQIRTFLATGSVEVNGLNITSEMLKVTKQFNETYANSKQYASFSGSAAVMLDIVQTESLMQHGLSREITNRIQRLRKTSGISIEDQIEIFYQYADGASAASEIGTVIKNYSDKIQFATKMPFHHVSARCDNQIFIGETEFAIPEKESERVKLYIHLAAPKFNDEALHADFDQFGNDKVNFVNDLKSYVASFKREALKKIVEDANGELALTLNGNKVVLKHKKHFFYDLRDMHSA